MRRIAILLSGLAFLALSASAQEASDTPVGADVPQAESDEVLVSNRPGFSNVTEVIPKGRVELNTGFGLSEVEDTDVESYGQILVRVGVGGPWELRLGLNSWVRVDGPDGSSDGFEDPTLGVKVGLAEGRVETGFGKPETSLILQSTIPVGDELIGADDPQPAAILLLAWNLSPRVHLDNNIAYIYRSLDDGSEYSEMAATLAFSIGLGGAWGTYLEYAGFFPLESEFSDSHFLFAAFTYLVNRKMAVDFGGGYGMNGLSPDYFVSGGLAYRW